MGYKARVLCQGTVHTPFHVAAVCRWVQNRAHMPPVPVEGTLCLSVFSCQAFPHRWPAGTKQSFN